MENGRCAWHGGLTPKGDDWHKPRWPDRDSPAAEQKLQRKLRDLERAAKKRAVRVAAMTPEELERYKRWHQVRRPGSAKRRAAAKRDREAAASVRTMLAEIDGTEMQSQGGRPNEHQQRGKRRRASCPDVFD